MTFPSHLDIAGLSDQQNWLLLALSCIGDAVITTDAKGRVTFLNRITESLTGWTLSEALRQPLDLVFRIIEGDTRQKVDVTSVQAFAEVHDCGLASPKLLIARDDSERRVDVSAATLSHDTGEVAGRVFVFRDITERQKTEQALSKALAYADDIIATLREPFLVLDSDLRVKTANCSFYDSFQVSKEETEKRYVYDLGNGQWDIPALRTLLDRVLSRNESVHDFEVVHRFPTLGRKTMLLNARPFPPDSKHPELILLAVEDVSALRERADELAQISRNKDEFLATLGHELRNPLAPISNAVQFLSKEGIADHEAEAARAVIGRQVTVMVRLIDDLLDVSRISRNKLDMRKQRIGLAAVIASSVESSQPLIKQCGHELTVDLPLEPVPLEADFVRLSQVFLNLLNNAAKYTRRGGHIWITAERQGGNVVVGVRDNGIGISENMLPRIFEMFTQADRSLERSQGGLGIGLTLVRRLVEMHSGTIEARSSGPSRGSEFVVTLPVVTEPLDEQTSGVDVPRASALSNSRILIVDDNQDSADTLGMFLRLDGNEIRTAYDGLEAVEVAETFHPEFVLLDINLPKLNGYEVARQIRQQPWARGATLVAVTGNGQDEDRRRSQEAGFDFYLVKPVDVIALEDLLAKSLSKA